MEILEVVVPVNDVEECGRFYEEVLSLPVDLSDDGSSLLVRVGGCRLRFEADTVQQRGYDHFAFTIPASKFDEAKWWLQQRVELLTRDGADEFEGPEGWNSRSVYFPGPSGSVLELIARRDLTADRPGPFTSIDLLNVSEVGIAVPDVLAAASRAAAAGWPVFAGASSAEFAAVGDQQGLLILVPPQRIWVPTSDRPAAERPLTIVARGTRSVTFTLGASPVRIETP